MGVKLVAALLVLPSLALAKPVAETLGELRVDFSAGTIDVRGAGAPDLRAPSAEVGRFKAERNARADATRRLRLGLAGLPAERLGCDDRSSLRIDDAVAHSTVPQIDWGSDGSVSLVLRVELARLGPPGREHLEGAPPAVLIDTRVRPSLFGGRECACEPPVFERLAEARARFSSLPDLAVVRAPAPGHKIVAIVRAE